MASAMTSSMSTQILLRLMTLLSAMTTGMTPKANHRVHGAKERAQRMLLLPSLCVLSVSLCSPWSAPALQGADDLGGYGLDGDGGFALGGIAGGS